MFYLGPFLFSKKGKEELSVTDSVHNYPEEKLRRARRNEPCPICGSPDWCGFNSIICSCMRIEEGSFKTVIQSNGTPAYLHWLKPGTVLYKREIFVNTVEVAPVKKRDKVYRAFLELLYLHQEHKKDLIERGLTEWDIKKNGYKSVPTEKPWEICRKLMEMGHELSGIPGFFQAKGPHGGTYWTFSRGAGYYIPVRDFDGRIKALQRRLDNPVKGKKYWIMSSSENEGGCSSGTPSHIAKPNEIKDNRIWITEGPLKSDIASKLLGAIVIGVMSAGTWMPILSDLDEIGEKEVVIAYDMDFRTNSLVNVALLMLQSRLKSKRTVVHQATWERKKGIDDALMAGEDIRITRL